MDLATAENICARAYEVGKLNGLQPLTIAVLDNGGQLILFKKQDGSSLFRESIARGKAMGALGLGTDSANLAKVASDRPAFMTAAMMASGGQVVPVPGGVLVRDANDKVIGAVGISGDLSDADEACAIAGIRHAGLKCQAIAEEKKCYLQAHL